MQQANSERRLQLAELEKIRNDAYENAKIYKQRMKVFHDKHVMRNSFTPGQKVLLFNFACTYSQVSYALDGLAPLLFILFFHMGRLKLRTQRTVSHLKLMVKD